jgi:GntR family transcriptional regulator
MRRDLMLPISRSSKLPLYQQIYEILRGDILAKNWKPGDMIPPESELTEQYRVSSITIRQALEMLEQEGLIYRQRGRGTFVAHPTLEQSLTRIISFTEDMNQRGSKPGTEVMESGLVPASEDIAKKLQIEPGEELAYVERLRLADGEPMSVEESHLIHRYCQGILKHDFAAKSMRRTLQEVFGIRLVMAKQTIRALQAPANLATLLSLKPGAAILFIERVSYSQYDLPLEFLRIYYRGDRYELYNELQG